MTFPVEKTKPLFDKLGQFGRKAFETLLDGKLQSTLHIVCATDDRNNPNHITDWMEAGEPAYWVAVESFENLFVLVDISYGRIALFDVGKNELSFNKNFVQLGDYIALDADYFGTPRYLYHAVNK